MVPKKYKLDDNIIDIYFQKSNKFLYPLLGIPVEGTVLPEISRERRINFLPINTYVAWQDQYKNYQCRLICAYELSDDLEFKEFEKMVLQRNEMFEDCFQAEHNKLIYVFNLERFKEDVEFFLAGKYSKISAVNKTAILRSANINQWTREYIDSYLYPEKYFHIYAKHLSVPETSYIASEVTITEQLLRRIGELCDPYNLEKETLHLKVMETVIMN